jgi:hypothetical protein
LILLHRTFPSQPHSQNQQSSRHSSATHFSTLSRNVCISNAVQIAEIISAYRTRYSLQRIFVTGLQHVGTAATALMAEISMLQSERDGTERGRLLGHLNDLGVCLGEMSETYQPAVLMTNVVGHFVRDSSDPSSDSHTAVLPPHDAAIDPALSEQPTTLPISARGTRASTLAPPDFTTSSLSKQFPDSTRGMTPLFGGFQASSMGLGAFDGGGGLPFLPSSWFEEMDWEQDNEFLGLMGLKDLQGVSSGAGGGLVDGFERLDGG